MLSAFPATFSSEGFFANPFPPFEGGFTPWDPQEPPAFVLPSPVHNEPVVSPKQTHEPVDSNSSGSDNSNPSPLTPNSNSGSDDPDQNHNKNNPKSVSVDTNRTEPNTVVDERKRRRMISNRESARRSRMRKQKHLENLRNQATRLRISNRELMNRLRFASQQNQLVRRDNDRLKSESAFLRQRLSDVRQVLLVRELQQRLNASPWPCNDVTSIPTNPQPILQ